MGPLIVAFVIGVASAATLEVGRKLLEWREHKSGDLAGWWYQITWNPDKPDELWSIEWIHVKHHRRDLMGTMWRVYTERQGKPVATDENLKKYWKFAGCVDGHSVYGHYSCKSGEGWNGTFQMARYSSTHYVGKFRAIAPDSDSESTSPWETAGLGPPLKEFSPVVEWVKCECEREAAELLPLLHTQDLHLMSRHLPEGCATEFKARFDPTLRSARRRLRSLAYGAATGDRLAVYALEDANRREREAAEAALDQQAVPRLTPPFRVDP